MFSHLLLVNAFLLLLHFVVVVWLLLLLFFFNVISTHLILATALIGQHGSAHGGCRACCIYAFLHCCAIFKIRDLIQLEAHCGGWRNRGGAVLDRALEIVIAAAIANRDVIENFWVVCLMTLDGVSIVVCRHWEGCRWEQISNTLLELKRNTNRKEKLRKKSFLRLQLPPTPQPLARTQPVPSSSFLPKKGVDNPFWFDKENRTETY